MTMVDSASDVVVLTRGTFMVIEDAIRRARNHAIISCPDTCRPQLDAVLNLLRIAGQETGGTDDNG